MLRGFPSKVYWKHSRIQAVPIPSIIISNPRVFRLPSERTVHAFGGHSPWHVTRLREPKPRDRKWEQHRGSSPRKTWQLVKWTRKQGAIGALTQPPYSSTLCMHANKLYVIHIRREQFGPNFCLFPTYASHYRNTNKPKSQAAEQKEEFLRPKAVKPPGFIHVTFNSTSPDRFLLSTLGPWPFLVVAEDNCEAPLYPKCIAMRHNRT